MIHHPNAPSVARQYIGCDILPTPLGWGMDGVIYPSPHATTAVKVHSSEGSYLKELAVYKRPCRHKVTEFMGFHIPVLVKFSDSLRVIEMSIVRPPFLLDFSGATLDHQPDWGEVRMQEWWDGLLEKFGENRFPIARDVFYGLRRQYRIYYWDLKPGNLEF